MKKILSSFIAAVMLMSLTIPAIASEDIPTKENATVMTVTHEDGSQDTIVPEISIQKIESNSRTGIDKFAVSVKASTPLKGKTGSTSSKLGDATIQATFYYYTSGTQVIADEFSGSFKTNASGTVFSNRKATVWGNASSKVYSSLAMSFSKTSINYIGTMVNRPRLDVSANVEGYGFNDSLTLNIVV